VFRRLRRPNTPQTPHNWDDIPKEQGQCPHSPKFGGQANRDDLLHESRISSKRMTDFKGVKIECGRSFRFSSRGNFIQNRYYRYSPSNPVIK
jgi:hypothetical protein